VKAGTQSVNFNALDECHQHIHVHLESLAKLAKQMEAGEIRESDKASAGLIESFFSSTARDHHAHEELHVFPPLLKTGNEELASAVHALHQDHGFIEENWIELGPQLRAIASGNNWFDAAEFLHNAEVFLELCGGHIALEETLIYPESKALWAQAVAARKARPAA
jgi:hemerythrin-like domain-containing protein